MTGTESRSQRFPIRTVAALTGVKTITLRAWERRYGLIRPTRTPKGHRLYTHADIEQIRRVLALLDRGVQIGHINEALTSQQAPGRPARRGKWDAQLERIAAAVSRFDEEDLDSICDEALAIHSIEQVTHELLLPALVRLGERWKGHAGGIAEEHFLAAYLRSKLGARLQRPSRYARGPRLMVACAPLEFHEIGLLLFALEARAAGFRITLLGADNPLAELAAAHRQAQSDALVISSSVGTVSWVYEGDLAALVRRVKVPVFIGGATALMHRKALVQAGAIPLGADARDALGIIATNLGRSAAAIRP
ncbi:MAG TPA: MerR family transcriptional regulator [Steroidobacteraceae bacterium]